MESEQLPGAVWVPVYTSKDLMGEETDRTLTSTSKMLFFLKKIRSVVAAFFLFLELAPVRASAPSLLRGSIGQHLLREPPVPPGAAPRRPRTPELLISEN